MNIFYFHKTENIISTQKPACNPWVIRTRGLNIQTEREFETVSALSNGFIGTRNSIEEYCGNISTPATFIAGFYEIDEIEQIEQLVLAPDWTRIKIFVDDKPLNLFNTTTIEHKRYLNLKKGICTREWVNIDNIGRITNIKINKLISFAQKNLSFKCITIQPENYCGNIKVQSSIDGNINSGVSNYEILSNDEMLTYIIKSEGFENITAITQSSKFNFLSDSNYTSCPEFTNINFSHKFSGAEGIEQWEWHAKIDRIYNISSIISTFCNVDNDNPVEQSRQIITKPENLDFIECIERHQKEINNIWDFTFIEIEGDPDAQQWINFAIYQLISAGKFSGNNYSIPARTLTGESYKGHVFWDTEIYLLPFFIMNFPDIAKDLLMYRFNTLDGARANAINEGYRGACYAWESASSGLETTPSEAILPDGTVIPIYSGKYENHISPDIAYTIWLYYICTGDKEFLLDYGAEIIIETARFSSSLAQKEDDGFYHIRNVVGPDEYHELVDDNVYTNIMVANNIDICLKVFELFEKDNVDKLCDLRNKLSLKKQELLHWAEIKDNLYIGFDDRTGIFEQFKGYHQLEDINVYDYEPRSAAMDILLGRERTVKTKVIKQPDVLMFLFLLKSNFSNNVIKANYDYYEPKTGHGSSLSPSIHSIIASWIGKKKDAYRFFEQNALIDLGNKMGNASGGIHIASQGGSWLAVVRGFCGIHPTEEGILINPNLPDKWKNIKLKLKWLGQTISFEISNKKISIKNLGNTEVKIKVKETDWTNIKPDINYEVYFDEKWKWV